LGTGNAPLISVVIPAWDCQETITKTILNIGTNTETPLEAIVVDDQSTDATFENATQAMRNSGIKNGVVLQQSNSGLGAARNTGQSGQKGVIWLFWMPTTSGLSGHQKSALMCWANSGKRVINLLYSFCNISILNLATHPETLPAGRCKSGNSIVLLIQLFARAALALVL